MSHINILVILIPLLILALCVWRGWRRGLTGIIYGFASWIFIIVFVMQMTPPTIEEMKQTPVIYDSICDQIRPFVESYVPALGFRFLHDGIVNNATQAAALYIIKVLAVVVVYLGAKLICVAIKTALNVLTDLPLLGKTMRLAGALFGLLESYLYISILLFVLMLIKDLPAREIAMTVEAVEATPVLSYLYSHNILTGFLSLL